MNKDVLLAKQNIVSEIVAQAKDSSSIVVAEYRGLTVAQLQQLRRALRAEGAQMNVYKNSMLERASDELGYTDLKQVLTGPNAVFFSKEVNGAAKVLAKYAKRFEGLNIKGGVFEGQYGDKAKVLEVAKMPNKEGLLAMLLSCLQAPVRQFACTVKAVADAK